MMTPAQLTIEGTLASPPEIVRGPDEFDPMVRARVHLELPAGGDDGKGEEQALSLDLVATHDPRLFHLLANARMGDTVQAAGELRRHPRTRRAELWAEMLAVLPEAPEEAAA